MFKFDKNSAIVNAWVSLIRNGEKNLEDVPPLFNLIEIVSEILGGEE